MIDRQHGKLVFECDTCDVTFASDTGNFEEAWNEAKAEGWRATKVGETWEHACPDCGGA